MAAGGFCRSEMAKFKAYRCRNRYLPQHKLLEFCKENNIHVTAHSPLGGAPVGVVALHAGEPGPLDDPLARKPQAATWMELLTNFIDH